MNEDLPSSHKGKIGSLPASIREEVNRRLHDGQTAAEICDWLNAEEAVLKILDEKWNEQPISPQNLSEWRKGGFQIYLRNRSRAEHLKTLTDRSISLVDSVAVGKLTGAAQRIVAGQFLDLLESVDEGDAIGLIEALGELTRSIDRTEKNEIARTKLSLNERQVEQRQAELELNREKFEVTTVTQFLRWQGSKEAQAILDSGKPQHVQAEQLRQLFFGSMMEGGER